jgi:hypothetical protein
VTKLRGDAYGAMMKAQGAQAFLNNGYGEANLRNYRDAWTRTLTREFLKQWQFLTLIV